ncbi:MAG: SpoIVB peptidase S55 domain-containing protein [Phycisphaerae bacterium]|jgi:hypothetical protein
MLRFFTKPKTGLFLFFLLVSFCPFCWAKNADDEVWDPAKYIGVDEIAPGMEAYCLTIYNGTEIERFGLKVLSIVRNIEPGRDAILVQGTDERFIHSGPVWGCSGSPVYIDGRLAGALSFAFYFSKDPLYGVMPIKDMLMVGRQQNTVQKSTTAGGFRQPAFSFDFSKPIDFSEIGRQITTGGRVSTKNVRTGMTFLPCPLITTGLPDEVCEKLNNSIEPFGLVAVSGAAGGGTSSDTEGVSQPSDVRLAPGSCLVVPLVTGDISMAAVGTATEVVGDKVYGFGHDFLGSGTIDLPMATGRVHTIVSSIMRSFKLAGPIEIVGALTSDETAGVCGRIGAKAKMIPLVITVDRYNDTGKRVYNCLIADNQMLTPLVLRSAAAGATVMLGDLPPDHTLEYKVTIGMEGVEAVAFENVSTGAGLDEMLEEIIGPVAVLLNNPYEKVNIKSIDFDVRIAAKNITSRIWSVDLSDSTVKAGQEVAVTIVVESFLAEKKRYRCSLKVPSELAPGKYNLIVCGGYDYRQFLMGAAPYKFIPQNLETLIVAMNNILSIGRDKLYCVLVLPGGGVAVEKAELPDLPATKVLLLQDAKRALRSQPNTTWLEESVVTGAVIIDQKVMNITVEE